MTPGWRLDGRYNAVLSFIPLGNAEALRLLPRIPTLRAHRAILKGEEITFNYNTTEYDMASPFECWETGSMVRGYAHLSAAERAAIAKYAAPHVLRLAEQENDALNVAAA